MGLINRNVKNAKNAICHEITTFFLYFFSAVTCNNLYVKYIVIVVHIRVIMDNINGKIEPVSSHIFSDVENVHGIFTESPRTNVIIKITILHTIQAIKLHTEFTNISVNIIFFGQNDIIYLLFL